jgi:putative ABC transport system ATP-binding protein
VARAVAKRPDILPCDEPTGALDYQTGVRVLSALEQVNRELGTTTAIITHNVPIAAVADRVITLADGMIARTVTQQARQSAAAGLGVEEQRVPVVERR